MNTTKSGTLYGYARVSTKQQHEDRQTSALADYGISPNHTFIDKQPGKDFERKQYKRLIRKLRQGDTLFIKSIDRLGRDYAEILNQWRLITKDIGADIVVIDMPLLDTRCRERDLTGTFIADLVLQILSYVAETERDAIRQRQSEGIAAARVKGVRFGRPPKDRPDRFGEIHESWKCGTLSARTAAKELGVSPRTFISWTSDAHCAQSRG